MAFPTEDDVVEKKNENTPRRGEKAKDVPRLVQPQELQTKFASHLPRSGRAGLFSALGASCLLAMHLQASERQLYSIPTSAERYRTRSASRIDISDLLLKGSTEEGGALDLPWIGPPLMVLSSRPSRNVGGAAKGKDLMEMNHCRGRERSVSCPFLDQGSLLCMYTGALCASELVAERLAKVAIGRKQLRDECSCQALRSSIVLNWPMVGRCKSM